MVARKGSNLLLPVAKWVGRRASRVEEGKGKSGERERKGKKVWPVMVLIGGEGREEVDG